MQHKVVIYYSASSLYMFRVSTTHIMRSTQNCNYSLRYWSYFFVKLPPVPRGGGGRGGTVIKVLCYKSEGRLFDPSWCHWNFSLT